MGRVVAVCMSSRKGEKKKPVAEASLTEDRGMEGDAHAGSGLRQVSILAVESGRTLAAKGLHALPGDFAENIATEGILLIGLKIGDRLAVGRDAVLEVTQIGKECHQRCEIFRQTGDCVMPREGLFFRVVRGGTVRAEDPVALMERHETPGLR